MSHGGYGATFGDDEHGSIIEVIQARQPQVLAFENVSGFARADPSTKSIPLVDAVRRLKEINKAGTDKPLFTAFKVFKL